jgi:hypothetical protein
MERLSITAEPEHAMAHRQRGPWPIILTLIGIVLLVILWSAYWVIASGLMRDRYESERARLAAQGVAFDCKAAHWGGFPFRFEHDCIAPTLTAEGDKIEAQNLLLVIQAYMPNRAIVLIDGPVTTASGVTVTHERAVASARFSGLHDGQATL